MKAGYLTLIVFALTHFYPLQSQLTISKADFPKAGDSLYLATDNLPYALDLKRPGTNLDWDFSLLQSPFIQEIQMARPSARQLTPAFATATAFTQNEQLTHYYRENPNQLDWLGFSGTDPLNFGLNLNFSFQPPLPERYASLSYGDLRMHTAQAVATFSADQLDNNMLRQLPIRPDSLRIRLQIDRRSDIDAQGRVLLPDGVYYAALREKRLEQRLISLDAKLGTLPWQDITNLIPGNPVLGKTQNISYHFFNSGSKEPIAEVWLDGSNKAIKVTYKADPTGTTPFQNPGEKPNFIAFPNPAIATVRFAFEHLPPGNYELKIFNILVQEVFSETYTINGSQTVQVDISQLRKGTYLYSLSDDKGKSLGTKRLIVLRP